MLDHNWTIIFLCVRTAEVIPFLKFPSSDDGCVLHSTDQISQRHETQRELKYLEVNKKSSKVRGTAAADCMWLLVPTSSCNRLVTAVLQRGVTEANEHEDLKKFVIAVDNRLLCAQSLRSLAEPIH